MPVDGNIAIVGLRVRAGVMGLIKNQEIGLIKVDQGLIGKVGSLRWLIMADG
jgi:hypothetical protein